MAGTTAVSGLVSGMSTDTIITQLMAIAKKPQDRLKTQLTNVQSEQTAWQTINAKVLALQTMVYSISKTSSFLAKKGASSDDTIATATASSSALPGIYDVKVSNRAQANQIASQTFDSLDADVGNGTFGVTFGNGTSFSVNVNQDNNTLTGLKDSINQADGGVTASIVNQGTEASPAYRLLLTSNNTGTDYKMNITSSGLNVTMDQEVQAAKDAQVTLGSGTNAITVTKSSNTITDLIPGVTLNIVKADTANPITVTVSKDTSAVSTSLNNFITQYNDLASTIATQFAYDSSTTETPILFGNYQLQTIQDKLASMVTGNAPGVTGKYSALSSVGITLGTDGKLSMDSTVLDSALSDNTDAVAKLFGADLTSESSLVKYAASTSKTQASTGSGWPVDITQAATRAQVTAGKAMDTTLASDEYMVVNGTKIALTAGMDIDKVVSAINSQSSKTYVSAYKSGADGTGTGNYITLRSNYYGSSYSFTASSNQPLSSSGTSGFGIIQVSPSNPSGESGDGKGTAGMDVAGTINGQTCTGKGQVLTANPESSSDPTTGLSIIATASKAMQTNVKFSKGVGASLQDLLTQYTSSTGTFTDIQDSLTKQVDSLNTEITDWETKLKTQSDNLYTKFNNMESQLSTLKSQGSAVTSMLSSNSSSSS